MKSLVKNALLISAHQLAKKTVAKIEQEMKEDNKNEQEQKQGILIASTIHALLSIIYND